MFGLAITFGCIVGFVLGLTGGGSGVFAMPLLVYGPTVFRISFWLDCCS